MKVIMIVSAVIIILILLGWLGLSIKPAPFPAFPQHQPKLETVPLPVDLPAPVERFYRQRHGETVPVITSAVISGRGTLKLFGVNLPIRFRFIHEAGQNFRSDIDITFFGQTVMQALEIYVDGHGYGKTPGGVDEGEAWFDQSANIRMWAEVIEFFPSTLLMTPSVHWEPIDDNTAMLVIPSGNTQDHLIVRFNPESNKIQFIEAMKYKNANTKMLWINGIWMDDGKPWIVMNVEEIIYNVDVSEYLQKSQ